MADADGDTTKALGDRGISLVGFVTALATSLVVFGIQMGLFLLLRNKLARIFKPKTYLVPERERTEPPPSSPWGLLLSLFRLQDREIINKCGLDSYFFLRYLQTMLIIFIPMATVIIPILVPINYVGGRSHDFSTNSTNTTEPKATDNQNNTISGLDTLAWGNVKDENYRRYWAHLVLAILVVIWVCGVFFAEFRVYIKVRQDWLTTAEHRLRASATTVLVSGIPDKWLSEEALRGLFDVFPGGIRNVWLTRDLTHLLDKIKKRDEIHKQLEEAQTELIRMAKKKQLEKREKDEKQARKASKSHRPTKTEKLERQKQEDAAARQRAEEGEGVSSGDQHDIPHDIHDAEEDIQHQQDHADTPSKGVKTGFSKITGGLGKGVDGLFGGAKNITHGIDNQIETTNGFVTIGTPQGGFAVRASTDRRVRILDEDDPPRPSTQASSRRKLSDAEDRVMGSSATRPNQSGNISLISDDEMLNKQSIEMRQFGNTTRKVENMDEMYNNEKAKWYEFWKPPAGGFASPVPQGYGDSEFPFGKKKPLGQTLKGFVPFLGGEEIAPVEYSKAYNDEDTEDRDGTAEWEKWIKRSKRPTHRVANFEWTPGWLPGLPFVNKKVDTIYWCRKELARLNHEIEVDQENPERYPLMKSAFIQFNHQVAAHMACQSVIHHVPKHMAPRVVEISPNDVIWDNMALSWWSEWLRTAIVIAVVAGMIILWAFPVAFTGSISQLNSLINTFPWLGFLAKNPTVWKVATAVAGVLPAILLALLLWLVPVVMDLLAGFKGAKTGTQKTEAVQQFYFAFLFVQVFLIVSLASGVVAILEGVLNDPTSVTDLLAKKLPSAANYFFSYMILQALSASSGTLLQIGALINWYLISRVFNSTARNKWTTNTTLPNVKWGSYFPVYTNFACIALVYSVITPIISIFAIITFSLLWIANKYSMLYVNRLSIDTGGVLYPRALNQTFTGLYVMEVALIGLFFIQEDGKGVHACTPQAVIMIVVTILTALYQLLLNMSFGPMLRYLPITFEDEAVLRDEAFQRAQDRRLGLIDEDEAKSFDEDSTSHRPGGDGPSDADEKEIRGNKLNNFKPIKGITQAGAWAIRGGKTTYNQTLGKAEKGIKNATKFRGERRQKDLEAQRAIGEALYGGFHDEIEDLTPEERDVLVRRAFMHSALRARRPTLWIPRDDLGISDDEIKRTQEFSEHIWISNEGTALDSKVRVVYGRAPPDFSELDIIQL
ncbi:hypothetical protein O1611_g6746 [Lasiodiplodia mahajangana]|uniref:Uncharacterized protein n=1 Tax=Lasiodiplodia mahajangana TaxID=1108764 RepID=A0ACC2JH92_9PEZI|nr:hypothetical protein O1611_g6746 [Lasiodiplodia mahajangana]